MDKSYFLTAMGEPVVDYKRQEPLWKGSEGEGNNKRYAAPLPACEKVSTGISVFDDFLPLAFGQKTAIFSKAGLGKSSILRKLINSNAFDHVVFALVGERSRELLTFIRDVKPDQSTKTTVVGAAASEPSIRKARVVDTALEVAGELVADGKKVLLVIDSITRYACALRDVGISSGEVPGRQGNPLSVFSGVSALLESASDYADDSSLTIVGSVLLESDFEDLIADFVKSVTDGHVFLSSKLANRGIFPAIDLLASQSRLSEVVFSEAEKKAAQTIRNAVAEFEELEDYIRFSGYRSGEQKSVDKAVKNRKCLDYWLLGEQTFSNLLENISSA
ncbi:hypothetical protein JF535_14965 [Microbulbifer salipaludis]|uniref:protein-secreting ATPase n=1 Tax=Microbulbifer salipaludis TaxID=187980 RepID=A0ABS3EA31_9GAMM|nr:hypothetical protein [Microbulbifer salipaludis]MBN8432151.1 hypothetical protein [Microbulbifer salipaludis]